MEFGRRWPVGVRHFFPGRTHSQHCPPRIYIFLKRNPIAVCAALRKSRPRRGRFGCYVLLAALYVLTRAADQVPVRQKEGLTHGFLSLRSLDDKRLAEGESTVTTQGDIVTNHLVFRFRDGSIYEDTSEFSQKTRFRLLKDHLIQKGPSFPQPMETWIDTGTGQVVVRYQTKDGKDHELKQKLTLPPDLANGILFTVIKDISPQAPLTTLSYLVTTPQPRIVKIEIFPEAKKRLAAGSDDEAVVYRLKFKIGGVSGVMAHLAHKEPPDTHVWVLRSDAPTFIKSEGPLYAGGPIWRIAVVGPPGNF